MSTLINIIIQIIAGMAGGNIAGIFKQLSLGPTANSIVGGLSGLVLGQIAPYLGSTAATATSALTTTSSVPGMVETAVGSGVTGIIVTAIIAIIKNLINKSTGTHL